MHEPRQADSDRLVSSPLSLATVPRVAGARSGVSGTGSPWRIRELSEANSSSLSVPESCI